MVHHHDDQKTLTHQQDGREKRHEAHTNGRQHQKRVAGCQQEQDVVDELGRRIQVVFDVGADRWRQHSAHRLNAPQAFVKAVTVVHGSVSVVVW